MEWEGGEAQQRESYEQLHESQKHQEPDIVDAAVQQNDDQGRTSCSRDYEKNFHVRPTGQGDRQDSRELFPLLLDVDYQEQREEGRGDQQLASTDRYKEHRHAPQNLSSQLPHDVDQGRRADDHDNRALSSKDRNYEGRSRHHGRDYGRSRGYDHHDGYDEYEDTDQYARRGRDGYADRNTYRQYYKGHGTW